MNASGGAPGARLGHHQRVHEVSGRMAEAQKKGAPPLVLAQLRQQHLNLLVGLHGLGTHGEGKGDIGVSLALQNWQSSACGAQQAGVQSAGFVSGVRSGGGA